MFENIASFIKKAFGGDSKKVKSKDTAKERLHLVLVQDRASVSADFLDAMKQEIIEVIKKYIEVDEKAIDVRLTNSTNEDGTNGAPALYANIPITNVKVADVKKADEERREETTLAKSEEEPVTQDVQKNIEQNDETENINEEIEQNDFQENKIEENEQNNDEHIGEQIEEKQENPEEAEKVEAVNTAQNN